MGVARKGKHKELPLSTAPEHRERLARAEDPEHMLGVFARELPALADAAVRVSGCSVKPSNWRKSLKSRRFNLVYELELEVGAGPGREYLLLGITPVTPEFLDEELGQGVPRAHPWAAPFRRSVAYLPELQMALLFSPLDPAMPGLAEVTCGGGARTIEPWLPECRAGARVEALECELVHYKPFDRAVLKIGVTLLGPGTGRSHRTVYAKLFSDEDGAECHASLAALWTATRGATHLRLPEPLGYDPQRRMLLMSEARGGRDLTEWIKCVEGGEPLPDGVGMERLDACALASARALRELQRSDVLPGTRRTFQDELGRSKRDGALLLEEVRKSEPELAASTTALLARLERLAPAHERLVPAHGAFRHKQMLGNDLGLWVIDWDGLCLANPALDAAAFLGRLGREPLLRPGAAPELERMAALFRSAFLEDQPEVAVDLDLYEGLEMTEQILRSFRRPAYDRKRTEQVRSLAQAAGARLDRVEAARGRALKTGAVRWLAHGAAASVLHLLDSFVRKFGGNGLS